jgi:hypothetical protein
MMFIEIVGTSAQLCELFSVPGLEISSARHRLGGGRHRLHVYVTNKDALAAITKCGATYKVTMDEAEFMRRVLADQAMMRRAHREEAEKLAAAKQPGYGDKPRDPSKS